jgi:hypothetical protein
MLHRTILALCSLFILLLVGCDSTSGPGPGEPADPGALVLYDSAQSSVDTLRQGRSYGVKVEGPGSGLSYRWGFRGVWTAPDTSPRFALPILRKSDSGTSVFCIVSRASGVDTLERRLRVVMASWGEITLVSGAQGSGSYGPLLNFDTAADSDMDQRQTMAVGNEINLDLVTGFIATGAGPNPPGVYKLMTPRFAFRIGFASTSGMDSSRLTATPFVLVPRSSLEHASQEQAQALYDQGVKRDSVTFADSGSFGGSASNVVLVKTTKGRLVQLTGTTFIGGSDIETYYSLSGKRGTIPD